jgi:hypothetical protein
MSYLSAKKLSLSNIHWDSNTEQLLYQDPYITTLGLMIHLHNISVIPTPSHYKVYLHSQQDINHIYDIYDYLHKTYKEIMSVRHIPMISLSRNTLTDEYFKKPITECDIIFKYLKNKPGYSHIITHVSL